MTGISHKLQQYKHDLSHINMIYVKDVESSMLGPLSQSFVCDLTNINQTLNCMVKESKDLNRKNTKIIEN